MAESDVSLESVQSKIDRIESEMQKVLTAIYGNGKDGLIVVTSKLVDRMEAMAARDKENSRISWQFLLMLLAILANIAITLLI